MFSAQDVWCIADVSSVAISSEHLKDGYSNICMRRIEEPSLLVLRSVLPPVAIPTKRHLQLFSTSPVMHCLIQ